MSVADRTAPSMIRALATTLAMLAAAPAVAADIDAAAKAAMAGTGANGLAIAVIDRGRVASVRTFGVRNARRDPLTPDTVMYGASLTKVVFAYLVAQLADEGRIDLDTPIARYLPRPLPDYGNLDAYGNWGDLAADDRWRRLTPRMLLNHASGFANFSFLEPDGKLSFHFDPGTHYGYSGEGIVLLQFVLEKGLGLDVEAELQRRVFRPAGARMIGLVWRAEFAANLADGWDEAGKAHPHDDRGRVRASGSMDATPTDLAKAFAFILRGEGLSKAARAAFVRGTLPITTASQFPTPQPDAPPSARTRAKSGLGVIAFDGPQGPGWVRGGHDDITANTLVCLERRRRCVLVMSNDVRAEAAFPTLTRALLGETGVPYRWLYPGLKAY